MVEMTARGVPFIREAELPIHYKGHLLSTHYRADFVCFSCVIVELKALRALGNIEEAQLLNYLKVTGMERGVLLNFGASSLEYKRFARSRNQSAKAVDLIFEEL